MQIFDQFQDFTGILSYHMSVVTKTGKKYLH